MIDLPAASWLTCVGIIDAPEGDGIGRAGLGAGRLDFPIPHAAVLRVSQVLRPADALDAESAFFHHTPPPDGHIRIEGIVQGFGPGKIPPVKLTHLVRTVVGAIAGADAAVVDLEIGLLGFAVD